MVAKTIHLWLKANSIAKYLTGWLGIRPHSDASPGDGTRTDSPHPHSTAHMDILGYFPQNQILPSGLHYPSPSFENKPQAPQSITMNKASGGDGIPVELFQILKDDAVKVLHSICQHIWKTQQWPQDWKRSVFLPIPKKGNAKECSNYRTIAPISHASKVMLKILQAMLNITWTMYFKVFKLDLEKAEETEIKLPTSFDHQKSTRVPEKHLMLLYSLCQSRWLCGSQ